MLLTFLQLKSIKCRLCRVPLACRESSGPFFVCPCVASIVRSLHSGLRSLESRGKLVASEEDGEAGERGSALSPALPPASVSLSRAASSPVLIQSVQLRSPLAAGEASILAGLERPRIVAQLDGVHTKSLLCRSS